MVTGAYTDPFVAFFDPAYQLPAYSPSYPAIHPEFHCFHGNNHNLYVDDSNHSSLNFGATHAQFTRPSPPAVPQLSPSQTLPLCFYEPGNRSFQQTERRYNDLRLNQESRPLVGFAPVNDNNLPPAGVSLDSRLPEHVTPPRLEFLRFPQLRRFSPDYDLAYNRPQAPAPETAGLDQAEGLPRPPSSNLREFLDAENGYFNENIQDQSSQEQEHIPAEYTPGEWMPREWIAGREYYTNDRSRGHSSASVSCEDHDLIMPSQARSLTPREPGVSRKRPRSSVDAAAGPSGQKKRTVSVASRAAAKVRKAPGQTLAAGWDQDDPFNIKDDEDKKIDMVDMTADDNIPDELQILPDPPSTKLSKFECIICLDTASTLTVTHCGVSPYFTWE